MARAFLSSRSRPARMMRPPLWLCLLLCLLQGPAASGLNGEADPDDAAPTVVVDSQTVYANQGANISLKCTGRRSGDQAVNWIYPSSDGGDSSLPPADFAARSRPAANGDLFLSRLRAADSKTYLCQDAESNESLHSVHLVVRTPPPAVANLTVAAHSVYALVTWSLPGDGGFPVERYALRYRQDRTRLTEEEEARALAAGAPASPYAWRDVPGVGAQATSKTVYGLEPNTTYYFSVRAVNHLGPAHDVSAMVRTTYDPEEVEEAEELQAEAEEDERLKERSSYAKVWLLALGAFGLTFIVIGFGISLLLMRNCDRTRSNSSCETTEEEAMELVPHITLNPSFNIDMLEYIEAEEPVAAPANGGGRGGGGGGQNSIGISVGDDDDGDEVSLVSSPARGKSGSRPNG